MFINKFDALRAQPIEGALIPSPGMTVIYQLLLKSKRLAGLSDIRVRFWEFS
jgi:hypothetical protein